MNSPVKVLAVTLSVVSLVACSSGSNSNVSTTVPADVTTTTVAAPTSVTVIVGTDSGPDRIEKVALGAPVDIVLTNNAAADNYHLHGYDIETGEVEAGVSATISFTADKAGDFEVESHVTEDVLVVIRVG